MNFSDGRTKAKFIKTEDAAEVASERFGVSPRTIESFLENVPQ